MQDHAVDIDDRFTQEFPKELQDEVKTLADELRAWKESMHGHNARLKHAKPDRLVDEATVRSAFVDLITILTGHSPYVMPVLVTFACGMQDALKGHIPEDELAAAQPYLDKLLKLQHELARATSVEAVQNKYLRDMFRTLVEGGPDRLELLLRYAIFGLDD